MSETEENGTSAETTAPTPKDVAGATQDRATETPEQTIEGLRAALAKANAEAKENRIKARELDEVKQSQMSDLERAQAQAKSLEEEATTARAEALRWRTAAKHGISDEDAETFLTGTDEETLTRQAERLASLSSSAPTTPKPDLSQGSQGETTSGKSIEDQFAEWSDSTF